MTDLVTETLAPMRTEMSPHVPPYNLKRVTRLLGIGEMLRAMSA